MYIDFHTHANIARKIPISAQELEEKVQKAKQTGLDAIAITEHFNAVNIIELYDMLEKSFRYKKNYYKIAGMKVFCGLEIDVQENGHFLVVGDREDIVAISHSLLDYHQEDNFIAVKQLIKILEDFEVIKIGAHPLRESTPWTHHKPSILKQFDAFDLNSKDIYSYGTKMIKSVHEFANTYDIPVVGGSDTHHPLQYGTIRNKFPSCGTITALKKAIKKGKYTTFISPTLPSRVKMAKKMKRKIKQSLQMTK